VSLRLLKRPHVLLVVFLMAMLAIFPFIERSGVGRCVLNLLIVAAIVASLHRVHASRTGVIVIAALGAIAVAGQMLHEAKLPGPSGFVSAMSQTLFYAIAAGLMCIYMLGDTRATIDELFAAAAAFMLLALAWATGFWCIEHLDPGAFASAHPILPEHRTWFEFLYLSMTTLSTTGYGDVVPVSSGARAAVMLEQFVGVLYVALVISRLAGFAGRPSRAGVR
jgi:hypothetical protein